MRRGEEGLRHSLPPFKTLLLCLSLSLSLCFCASISVSPSLSVSVSLSVCSVVSIVSLSDFMEKVQSASSLRMGWHLDGQRALELSCEEEKGVETLKQV